MLKPTRRQRLKQLKSVKKVITNPARRKRIKQLKQFRIS